MVKVPTQKLQSIVPEAAPTVFRDPNVPVGAFGAIDQSGAGIAELGRGLASGASNIANIAIQMQQEDNEAEVKGLDVQVTQAIRTIVHGNLETGNIGYYNTQGKNAIANYSATGEAINQAITEIIGSSSNGAVQQQISQMAAVRAEREAEKITIHAQRERLSHLNATSTARITEANSDAVAAWEDPNKLTLSLSVIQNEIADVAERMGLSIEEQEVMTMQAHSVTIKSVFDVALAHENTIYAMSILSNYADFIDGLTRAAMEEQLIKDTVATEAQILADSARLEFPDEPEKARDYIRDASSGKKRDKALADYERQIKSARGDFRFEETEKKAKQADVRFAETIENIRRARDSEAIKIYNHQRRLDELDEKKDVEENSAHVRNFLYTEDADTPRTMRQYRLEFPERFEFLSERRLVRDLVALQREINVGRIYAPISDNKTLEAELKKSAFDLAQIDPILKQKELTRSEYEDYRDAIASARKTVERLGKDRGIFDAGRRALNRFAPKHFGKPGTKARSTAEQNIVNTANNALGVWIARFQRSYEKNPTIPELNTRAAELMTEIIADPPGLFNTFEGLVAEANTMTNAQKAVARVNSENIPATTRDKIIASAKELGIAGELSEDDMEELAGALAMRDRLRWNILIERAKSSPGERARKTFESRRKEVFE